MKKIKCISTLIVAIAVILVAAVPTQAAGLFDQESYETVVVGSNWSSVALDMNGINRSIKLTSIPKNVTRIDIRMLDENARVIWQQDGAMQPVGQKTINAGPNVYWVQVRLFGIHSRVSCRFIVKKL